MWHVISVIFTLAGVSGYIGPKMGVENECDDGKHNLLMDWNPADFSFYTCTNESFPVREDIQPVLFEMKLVNSSFDPCRDVVRHKCMSESIQYDDSPPVRGDHRPNWARYGEYLYVPEQRWLHNLEHGSIILLYHPCANKEQVQKLRDVVTNCLYRHVITPYKKLRKDRPLALVSWGAKVEMSYVDRDLTVTFIKDHARTAPEDTSRDGIYNEYLLQPANIVSDAMDNELCKNLE